jgi:hypothetical protein
MTQEALETVFTTRPEPEQCEHDEIRVVRPDGWRAALKRPYRCGHWDTPLYKIDAYGEVFRPRRKFRRGKCGSCMRDEIERISARCPLTGQIILPGDYIRLLIYPLPDPMPPYTRVIEIDGRVSVVTYTDYGSDLSGFWHPDGTVLLAFDKIHVPTRFASELAG